MFDHSFAYRIRHYINVTINYLYNFRYYALYSLFYYYRNIINHNRRLSEIIRKISRPKGIDFLLEFCHGQKKDLRSS